VAVGSGSTGSARAVAAGLPGRALACRPTGSALAGRPPARLAGQAVVGHSAGPAGAVDAGLATGRSALLGPQARPADSAHAARRRGALFGGGAGERAGVGRDEVGLTATKIPSAPAVRPARVRPPGRVWRRTRVRQGCVTHAGVPAVRDRGASVAGASCHEQHCGQRREGRSGEVTQRGHVRPRSALLDWSTVAPPSEAEQARSRRRWAEACQVW